MISSSVSLSSPATSVLFCFSVDGSHEKESDLWTASIVPLREVGTCRSIFFFLSRRRDRCRLAAFFFFLPLLSLSLLLMLPGSWNRLLLFFLSLFLLDKKLHWECANKQKKKTLATVLCVTHCTTSNTHTFPLSNSLCLSQTSAVAERRKGWSVYIDKNAYIPVLVISAEN